MNAMTSNALNAYAKVGVEMGVETASPHQLILMLYDGAISALVTARAHMQRKEIALKGQFLSKAIAIIDEGLKLSLDEKAGGELAQNLKALYDYMCSRLLMANLNNDIAAIDEVGRLLVDLKGAWASIGQQQKTVSSEAEVQPQQRSALSYGKA